MVRQLVNHAHVRPSDIIVYDARRDIYPAMLTKIWSENRDVRFVQWDAPASPQPINPGYGDYHGLEQAQWVEGVSYSLHQDEYHDAKLIPKQIMDATYLVNVALLKAHSYPYASAEGGDEGQTGVTMTGKNQFGSIKGTPELHDAINTIFSTGSIARADISPIRCIFRIPLLTTASSRTPIPTGHQVSWLRKMV